MTENNKPTSIHNDTLQSGNESELEPISGAQAREILEAAIRERLGDRWRDEETGWQKVTGHDFMARMTRGSRNVDFYVDLLGNVTIEEKEIDGAQSNGRVIAWSLLIVSLLVAFIVAHLAGLI